MTSATQRLLEIVRAAVVAAAVLSSVAPVRADPIVDQSFLTDSWSGFALLNRTSSAAQTFTVGLPGVLTGFDLALGKHHALPATGDVMVGVYSTAAGAPAGPALATGTLSAAAVGIMPFTSTQPFPVAALRGLSLNVAAGDNLAIVLATTGDFYAWGFGSGYPAGDAFVRMCETSPCGSGWVGLHQTDFMFRTYVSPVSAVPEPSSVALAGIGLAIASIARRLRRRPHAPS